MKKHRLLLVDDDPEILDILEIFLYSSYKIKTAINGFEALQLAEYEKFDAVVTDIMMPTLDGVKFLNRLRKTEFNEATPVIALTAFCTTLQTESLLNIGFTSVIAKPFTRETLFKAVSKTLEESSL